MVRITETLVRKKSEHNECLISSLEELSLHQENIERLENLQNWCRDLKILLLQSNLISKIENLSKLKRLEYLNLALNSIERIENLEQLESLKKLDLTLNFIGEITSIENLQSNYNLRELFLTGNPCYEYPKYREYIIGSLPQLEKLDCIDITKTDKLLAKRKLQENRTAMVQRQTQYFMERDTQKIRVQEQSKQLEQRMSLIDDEEERIKLFWQEKTENCPEVREQIAKFHNRVNKAQEYPEKVEKPAFQLFTAEGRPYNLNQAKLDFRFFDEPHAFILELKVYRYMDSSLVTVDVDVNYIRVNIRGKIFQIHLAEEVNPNDSIIQRSQTTGWLVIKVSKFNAKETLTFKTKTEKRTLMKKSIELTETVNLNSICDEFANMPDLIDD